MTDIERKPVFALANTDDGAHVVLVGLPKTAFDDMIANGTSCDFDLRKAGVPLVLAIFAGENHTACMAEIQKIASTLGITIADERRRDFSIQGNKQ